MTSHLPQKANP